MKKGAGLPAELWEPIVDLIVATYIGELWMRMPSTVVQRALYGAGLSPVKSLLRVSFKIRHTTLKSLSQFLGIAYNTDELGKLDVDPSQPIEAVYQLWHTIDPEVQNREVFRLSEQSQMIEAYAHLVAGLVQSRALLNTVMVARNFDGSIREGVEVGDGWMGLRSRTLELSAEQRMQHCIALLGTKPLQFSPSLAEHTEILSLLFPLARAVWHAHYFIERCCHFARVLFVAPNDVPCAIPDPGYRDELSQTLWNGFRNAESFSQVFKLQDDQLLASFDLLVGREIFIVASRIFWEVMSIHGPGDVYKDIGASARRWKEIVDTRLAAKQS